MGDLLNYKPQDLKALGSKVIIKLDKWDNKAQHGIIMAQESEITPCEGEIVSKGPRVKSTVFLGDRVRTRKYAGLIFWINDDRTEKYISIEEQELDFVFDGQGSGVCLDNPFKGFVGVNDGLE